MLVRVNEGLDNCLPELAPVLLALFSLMNWMLYVQREVAQDLRMYALN
jgi:hypothetical protein